MIWPPLGEVVNEDWYLHYIHFIWRKAITSIKTVQVTARAGRAWKNVQDLKLPVA